MEDLKINAVGPGEYTFRVGAALELKAPLNINISGMLSAPAEWLSKKAAEYDPKDAHLIVDKDNNKLTLTLDEYQPTSRDVITGSLTDDVELAKWQINTSKRWTVNELLQFVRERKYFFTDGAEQEKLLASLQKWNVNINREIKKHNDNSGNSLDSLETNVTKVEGLVKQFNLSIPIFKGYEKKTFSVQFGLDPKSTQVDLYMFSDELFTLKKTLLDSLFAQELAKFKALNFDCSVVNIS